MQSIYESILAYPGILTCILITPTTFYLNFHFVCLWYIVIPFEMPQKFSPLLSLSWYGNHKKEQCTSWDIRHGFALPDQRPGNTCRHSKQSVHRHAEAHKHLSLQF